MRKLLVCLVSILAVIMPLSALGAEMTHYDLVPTRVIELNGDQMQIDGNAGGWLGQNFASTIRQATMETDFVKIAVSGQQFSAIADTQDRIQDSGRYKQSSRELVRRDSMTAPSEHFSVSVFASVDYKNQGGIVSLLTKGRVNVDSTKAKAKVVLTIEPIDINSGLNSGRGYKTTGEASKTLNLNVSAAGFNDYGGYNSGDSNPEATLIAEAAGKAVRELVNKLTADAVKDPICSVDITSGKSVWKIGTEISFYRNDKPIASYEILAVEGRTLAVRTLVQDQLPKAGDPFKIK